MFALREAAKGRDGQSRETGDDLFLMWETDTRDICFAFISCVIFIYILDIIKKLIS